MTRDAMDGGCLSSFDVRLHYWLMFATNLQIILGTSSYDSSLPSYLCVIA
jgi:hypothetical protein